MKFNISTFLEIKLSFKNERDISLVSREREKFAGEERHSLSVTLAATCRQELAALTTLCSSSKVSISRRQMSRSTRLSYWWLQSLQTPRQLATSISQYFPGQISNCIN